MKVPANWDATRLATNGIKRAPAGQAMNPEVKLPAVAVRTMVP
jgi:hypothetical protein